MARGAYVGINNVARKVRKMYVGVGGVARKVKKGYIGIGGVARLFYRSFIEARKISSSLTTWSDYIQGGCGASVGNYALFAGYTNTTYNFQATVVAFSNTLTRSTPASLSSARGGLTATNTSSHAIFAGGDSTPIVDAFNSSFTRTALSTPHSYWSVMGATSFANKALLAGGKASYSSSYWSDVYSYDTSLTRTSLTALSVKRSGIYAASNDSYAIFAGGEGSSYYDVVDAYNTSFTRVTAPSLDEALYEWNGNATAAGMKTHALLFPRSGSSNTAFNGKVYSYDTSLTKTFAPNRYYVGSSFGWAALPAAVTVNNTVLVGGSSTYAPQSSSNDNNNGAELYDDSLTRTVADVFTHGRGTTFGAVAGDYAIFSGTANPNHTTDWGKTIEVYEVS